MANATERPGGTNEKGGAGKSYWRVQEAQNTVHENGQKNRKRGSGAIKTVGGVKMGGQKLVGKVMSVGQVITKRHCRACPPLSQSRGPIRQKRKRKGLPD